jgi:prepilin-type N-terminal cleavage/methylation domain-containing protein/prepilin-type processing-associated H-X9-DG protein
MLDRDQPGFTLIELLVVIAIMGILIALLLPAVQSAREAARLAQCGNNLRQIGMAVSLYQDAQGTYPMGRDTTIQYGVSWAFRLLPHLEQQAIYEAFNYKQRVDSAANAYAMRTPVATFFCPSRRSACADRDFDNNDQATRAPGVAAGGDYAANSGKVLVQDVAMKPRPNVSGPIYTASAVTPQQVRDGTSLTLAIGERYIPPSPPVPRPGFEHYDIGDCAFFSADTWSTLFGITGPGFPTGPLDPSLNKFGSEHGNLAQFAFLDGHVQTLNYSVSLTVLQALSVIADRTPISSSDY